MSLYFIYMLSVYHCTYLHCNNIFILIEPEFAVTYRMRGTWF